MEGNLIENLTRQIGDNGLIIQAKAMEQSTGKKLSQGEIERLLILIQNSDQFFNDELTKLKFVSVLLYLQAEYDEEKANLFSVKMEQWQNNSKSILRNNLNIEQLHLIFNIIEFEDKFRIMNAEKLKFLRMQLNIFEKLEKPFEEYVLFKYYNGILSFHLKDYHNAKMSSVDIIVDFTEEIQNKSPWIEYIELKNSLLNVKILEQENDYKEFLNTLECLYETYSKKTSQIAIMIGFKMCDINLAYYEFDKASTILLQVYKQIKKWLIFGNLNQKFPDSLEVCLNTISRVICANIYLGKNEESLKFVKKLEKMLNLTKEYDTKNLEVKESLIAKYQFYLIIFKQICKIGNVDKNELNNSINNYRLKFKNQINTEENVIINIYALNSSDVLAKNFFSNINEYMFIIKNNKFIQVNYTNLFFSLYNQISILTKNIATDSNTKKQFEYIEKIKLSSKSLVDYVNKYIDNSSCDLRFVCQFAYFKEVLIKIYIAYIFCFYFNREYKVALEIIKEFEGLKTKLNIGDNQMIKNYVGIIKLTGDIYFKMENFQQAAEYYSRVVGIYEEVNNHSQTMALVIFNLGISYLYLRDYQLAKKNLNLSKCKYELLNSIHPNQFADKFNQVNSLLGSLAHIIPNSD